MKCSSVVHVVCCHLFGCQFAASITHIEMDEGNTDKYTEGKVYSGSMIHGMTVMLIMLAMVILTIVVLLQMLVAATADGNDVHHGDDCCGTECLDSCTNLIDF